jgi:hypothetical protein
MARPPLITAESADADRELSVVRESTKVRAGRLALFLKDENLELPALFRAQCGDRINQRGVERGDQARQARDRPERQRRYRERRGIMRLHVVEQARDQPLLVSHVTTN